MTGRAPTGRRTTLAASTTRRGTTTRKRLVGTNQRGTPQRSTPQTTSPPPTPSRWPIARYRSVPPPRPPERSRWCPPTRRRRAGDVSPMGAVAHPARRRQPRASGHGRLPAVRDRPSRQDPPASPAYPLPERRSGRHVPGPVAEVDGDCRHRVEGARLHAGLGHCRRCGIQPMACHDGASLPTWPRRRKDQPPLPCPHHVYRPAWCPRHGSAGTARVFRRQPLHRPANGTGRSGQRQACG